MTYICHCRWELLVYYTQKWIDTTHGRGDECTIGLLRCISFIVYVMRVADGFGST